MHSQQYVAFDVETTGLDPYNCRIVEIGAVRFTLEDGEISTYQQLINPGCLMPPEAQAIHGISDADLAGKPFATEAIPVFLDYLGNPTVTVLVAHNAKFDMGFLNEEMRRVDPLIPLLYNNICTLKLVRSRFPSLRNHRLPYVAGELGLSLDTNHRALSDARRVMQLYNLIAHPHSFNARYRNISTTSHT